jgi:3-methyl-2-oxobutanoate hydroxymethyltransferase
MDMNRSRLTPTVFREMKQRGEKIAVLTAYDYPTARLLDESGVDALLVGDTVGMVVLGYPDTTHVTMDEMVHHTRAVARAAQSAMVWADLPIASYETPAQAVENGRRLIEAGAQAVKLEGGRSRAPQIKALTTAGISVVAHIGMLPQSVKEEGGYRIKGRTTEQAAALMDDALAIEEAGAIAVVLEIVVPDVSRAISERLKIPTIGIASGPHCDGQVLVTHDLVGLFPWFTPKFVKQRAHIAEDIRAAATAYVAATRAGEV